MKNLKIVSRNSTLNIVDSSSLSSKSLSISQLLNLYKKMQCSSTNSKNKDKYETFCFGLNVKALQKCKKVIELIEENYIFANVPSLNPKKVFSLKYNII